jgi:hypothetical protein
MDMGSAFAALFAKVIEPSEHGEHTLDHWAAYQVPANQAF